MILKDSNDVVLARDDGAFGEGEGRIHIPYSCEAADGVDKDIVDPYGSSVGAPSVAGKGGAWADDAKSVVSSTGGWGHPARGPWDSKSASSASDTNRKKGVKPTGPVAATSWADMVEEEDAQSVAETDGWGAISNGPWK